MARYAFWNNKGGVGKSFLTFTLACEYALENVDEDVLVLDLCPQANVTEMFFGGQVRASSALEKLYSEKPRRSVGGYFESRLTSPFIAPNDIQEFLIKPCEINPNIPSNLYLLAGDNLLELLSEAIRQASQMSLPADAWQKVMRWLYDFSKIFTDRSSASDIAVFTDCNPSFSIYTQIGLSASEYLVIPFTADDSSRRGIENVFALLYGISSSELQGYAKLSFSLRAKQDDVELPKIHTFVSNRTTMYKGKPSSAFEAKSVPIREVVSKASFGSKRNFVSHKENDELFSEMPDYHGVAVVASSEGCPLSKLKPGPHQIDEEVVQVNQNTIEKYKKAIRKLLIRL